MTARRGIVTGGTWCVDDNKVLTHWPEEDGLAEVLSVERHGGGSACSLAVDIKRLDPAMPVETIGVVADDEPGRFLLALAAGHGIDCHQLRVAEGETTPRTDAYASQRSRRRTHIYQLGAGRHLSPDHFDFARTNGRIFHAGLPGSHQVMDLPWQSDPNGWVAVLRKARAAGLKTNIELASIAPDRNAALAMPCLPYLDFLVVNDLEISALSGIKTVSSGVADATACERAARQVMEIGSPELVVVHCPAFAVAIARDGTALVRSSISIPASEVAGANGAGDAFAAGMLYGLHEQWSLYDTLGLAHATAAASLRSLGSSDSVGTWQENLTLAERWGWRT